MSGPLLSAALLRETGWERHDRAGYINLLGVSVQDGLFIRMAASWQIYERGVLGSDPDAEALSILVLDEVDIRPMHSLVEDPFDLCKRARYRLLNQPGCVNTITAIDLGGSTAGGDGYLLGNQIRQEIGHGVFALRTVSDADLPAPQFDSLHRAYRMSPEALIGALAAYAGARQILISDNAKIEARRVFTDALRAAGSVDARSAPPLTRLIAWAAEITAGRMIQPLVDRETRPAHRKEVGRGGIRRR